jgi:aryl-alcohol dehydrogenase-like predicted oxidoreductase
VSWLDSSELRIGLGCMRLPEELTFETIAAAAEAGMTVFDTARAYGDNERLLAHALRNCGADARARIVTKGGMTRAGGAWVPDGRAKAIRADCEASLAALDGLPIDLYLIHAPDPRTPWRTSVRALARLVDEGLVRRVGLANVNRRRLDEAFDLAPIAAVQVALSVWDDHAVRGGVVDRCEQAGVAVIAHSPLGGPKRAGRVDRRPELVELAAKHGVTPAEAALSWLLEL